MISAVILTKNEEKNILECIKSVKWCDEILLIDDYSDDNTVALVTGLNYPNLKIIKKHLTDNFAKQRNYALEKAGNSWVLFIDADERVSDSLQYEILNTINNSLDASNGYYIKRIDYMWGKPLHFGESAKISFLRLGRKDSGLWSGDVHERWSIKGKTAEFKNSLIHFPHEDIAAFLREINYYTDLRAAELYEMKIKSGYVQIIMYPVVKFIQNYIFRRGILDGIPGLISAILMSFHSFMVRGKLWLLWQKRDL